MSNIQVVVRCRERNPREVKAKSQIVVDLPSDQYSISQPSITINSSQNSQLSQKIINSIDSKTYTFDQVYGPLADQEMVFGKAVNPFFKEFLNGFNVTVLAYGQTGTGKTYTMCGKTDLPASRSVDINKHSGIIPRVLHELFRHLDSHKEDYFVKCSFIELYNENLRDLLNDDDDSPSGRQALKIFENKNGSSGILIQNLKEVNVNGLVSGFDLLKKGLAKRRVASTKLNDFSSRSHTIFTINLYRKDPRNSNIIKHSKINLVDLAGSENVSKSGSVNQRAKEAGSINQSLLTLGRVINLLSEKSVNGSAAVNLSHVPYRESKLTRLLQDSIGGKTKTLLISTISPAKINLEETLSTLEYSSKVKNIENKPQLGQDFDLIMKQVLVKDLSNEIIKLNSDLISTRNKNGIYMDQANYDSLIEENISNKNEMGELKLKVKQLTARIQSLEQELTLKDATELQYKQEIDTWKSRTSGLDQNISELQGNINQSINLVVALSQNESLMSANSGESLKLISSLSNYLNVMKGNFNHNFSQISKDIESSLTDLPSILNDLMKSLNNDENFSRFKKNHNELNSRLKTLNDQFQNYLVEYYNSLNVPSMIESFFKESIEQKVNEAKLILLSNLTKEIDTQYSNLNDLYKTSFSQFSNNMLMDNIHKITQESKNWNNQSNDIYKRVTLNLNEYQNNLKVSINNNQDKLTGASQSIKHNITESIKPTMASFHKTFTHDNARVNEQIPQINQLLNSTAGHLESNQKSIETLNSIFDPSQKRSPLKANQQKLNQSPSKNGGKSPEKLAKQPTLSMIPTLRDKENSLGPEPKKRKI